MAGWKNIPTQFNWDGENVTPVSSVKTATKPSPVRPASVAQPVMITAGKIPGLTNEERLAALKTEVALDTVLNMIPQDIEEVPLSPPEFSERPENLWEEPVQDLHLGNSAVYPDGRQIANPNHLVMFIQNGGRISRIYKSDGWHYELLRAGNRKNPILEALVSPLIHSGILKEIRTDLFGGDY
jgi:hypothetical protein